MKQGASTDLGSGRKLAEDWFGALLQSVQDQRQGARAVAQVEEFLEEKQRMGARVLRYGRHVALFSRLRGSAVFALLLLAAEGFPGTGGDSEPRAGQRKEEGKKSRELCRVVPGTTAGCQGLCGWRYEQLTPR